MSVEAGTAMVALSRHVVLAVAQTGEASVDSLALDSVALVEAESTSAVEREAAAGGHEAPSR